MDKITHNDFEKWHSFSLSQQMGNIGSEVSKIVRFKDTNNSRAEKSTVRALELIDLTIQSLVIKKRFPAVAEMLTHRELLCNFFYKGDSVTIPPEKLEKFYLSFYTGD